MNATIETTLRDRRAFLDDLVEFHNAYDALCETKPDGIDPIALHGKSLQTEKPGIQIYGGIELLAQAAHAPALLVDNENYEDYTSYYFDYRDYTFFQLTSKAKEAAQ